MTTIITGADIDAAADRISAYAVRTPLIESALLNERVGGRVLLKCETLQRTGSFKFRGAYNRLSQLSADDRTMGVIAWSSGNHAQGIAEAARILSISATIIMPEDAPSIKVANTRAYGATIRFYDRYRENREEIGFAMARETGAVLVPSYDDPHIIAGQGTVGREIMQDATALGVRVDQVFVPCSGGGLLTGTAVAVKAKSPDTQIYAAEPQDFNDFGRSLATGEPVTNDPSARSFCDALLAATPGHMTFPLAQDYVAGGVSVSDADVAYAMSFAFHTLKLVVEPGGAVALAAVLKAKRSVQNITTVVVLSGGNVDWPLFMKTVS